MGPVCLDNQSFLTAEAAVPSHEPRERVGESREDAILLTSDDESDYSSFDGQSDSPFPSISNLCLPAPDGLDCTSIARSGTYVDLLLRCHGQLTCLVR